MTQAIKPPPLGEAPYLPPIWHCNSIVHTYTHIGDGPCGNCKLIRPSSKTERMKTLNVQQHAILEAVFKHPGIATAELAELIKLSLERTAVAAGQMDERQLLRYERSGKHWQTLVWTPTDQTADYIDL